MTRPPLQDEAMRNRSVRLSDAEWLALARLGEQNAPRAGPATMVRAAVQEFLQRRAGKKKGGAK